MAARKSLGGAGLPPLADLFSTSDERALEAQTQERVMMLPVSELHNFPGIRFRYGMMKKWRSWRRASRSTAY